MKILNAILGIGIILTFLSCNSNKSNNESYAKNEEAADSTTSFISSNAAIENKNLGKKFIRTAEVKFKVNDVAKSTYHIENAVSNHQGYISNTNLNSDVLFTEEVKVSNDSTLKTTKYQVINNITLRVPNYKLDTLLKDIAKEVKFLDYRVIKADDVSLQMLSNNLIQNRVTQTEQRLKDAVSKNSKKLLETNQVEESIDHKQEQIDNSKISNLSLQDQVNYSTVNINIYQDQTIKTELVANDKTIKSFEPNFGVKFKESLTKGFEFIEDIILLLARVWLIIVFCLVAYWIYRKYLFKKIRLSA